MFNSFQFNTSEPGGLFNALLTIIVNAPATPAAQTTAATTGLLDMGAVITSAGDASGAVGDLVGVYYSTEAKVVA